MFLLGKMEKYPSLVEGTGLENRKVVQAAPGFESLFLRFNPKSIYGIVKNIAR